MRARQTLILFAKVPRLGRVKTRLAAALGAGRARSVYRQLSTPVIRRLAADRRWRTLLAVTPDRGVWAEWPARLQRVPQGRGDLGRRMSRALDRHAAPAAVLIGTDIPGASRRIIGRAFQVLRRSDFVFGPAEDGGYWLIGWRRRAAWPSRALKNVRWSSTYALGDTLASLPANRTAVLVDRLADVDDTYGYGRWRSTRNRFHV